MKKNAVLLGIFILARMLPVFAEVTNEFPEGLDPDMAALARISGLFDVEDPTSIYDFSVSDKEVEFIVDGSWEVALTSALAIDFSSGETVYGFTPPIFTQTVDLLSWILIDNTWYFESSFAEQFTRNTVAAGYIGNDGTAVKHVRVGNAGIVFPSGYPFISVGGGTAIAPGIMGTFAGERWKADAIIRYDTSSQESLVLSGMNEVNDTLVSAMRPVRGKWFVLPDAPVTGSVTVYVETTSGKLIDVSGRAWRKLEASEFTASGLTGTIELATPATGGVAVRYGNETYPGLESFVAETDDYFQSTGTTLSVYTGKNTYGDFVFGLDGGSALLVRERGFFSPFEALMRYAVEGSEFELVYAESGIRDTSFSVIPFGSGYAEIYAESGTESIRSSACRYPLAVKFPMLYFPSTGGVKIDTDLSVRSRSYTPITSISLGDDVIAGTIAITRNGVPDTAFRFDESSGILTMDIVPSPGETIRITWQKTDKSARNGTLTLAGGFSYRASDALEFSVGNALRWNTSNDSYTDASEGSPGSYSASAGIEWQKKSFSFGTAFAFDISIPDTTGYYRILGMGQTARTLYPDSTWYSRPLADASYVAPEGIDGDTMPTVSDSSVTGAVLAVRANLASNDAWTGADIATGNSGNADFSATKEISIALKTGGIASGYDIYLQLGIDSTSLHENPDSIREWPLQRPEETDRWTVRTVRLSAEDRRTIAGNNDMRLVVRPSSGSNPTSENPVSVHLYSGPIEIVESGFGSNNGEIESIEKYEPLTVERPLSSVSPSIINRFNTGTNSVLELSIKNTSIDSHVVASKTIPAIPLSSYRLFSFFMYIPEGFPDSATITVSLDKACELEIKPETLNDSAWHHYTVNLAEEHVLIDDSAADATVARVVMLDGTGVPTRVSLSFDGLPAPISGSDYNILFDEFYLEEPVSSRSVKNESTVSWKQSGPLVSIFSVPLVSDVSLSLTALSAASARQDETFTVSNIGGTATTAFTLHRSSFSGSIKASRETDGILENETHSVTIPFFFLTANEKYSTDILAGTLSRTDSLSVGGPLRIETSVSASQAGTTLDRKTNGRISPSIPETKAGTFDVSVSGTFSQTGSSPLDKIAGENWSLVWKESFLPLLSVGERDASRRGGNAVLSLGWKKEDFILSGLKLEGNAESSYSTGSVTTSGTKLSYSLSSPLVFKSFTLTPSWKRIASGTTPVERGGTWITDTKIVGESFSRMSWLYETAPVADLFDQSLYRKMSAEDKWSNTFGNEYSIEWRRPSPGLILDLWTPSTVTASINRETSTDASVDNVRDVWSSPVKAGFSALNMFGTRGALGIFDWYEEDEIEQLYAWTPKWGEGFFVWSADTWHSITVLFADSGTLSAENTIHFNSNDISGTGQLFRDSVRLIWKRPGKSSPLLAPVEKLSKLPVAVRREDTLTNTLSVTDKKREMAMAFDHAMITVIGKNAEIKCSAGTGFSAADNKLIRIDFRLGISGKLSY